jgi:hypothetical protein
MHDITSAATTLCLERGAVEPPSYRSGRMKSWIKVKNPAALRIIDEGAWQPRRTLRDYSSAAYTVPSTTL